VSLVVHLSALSVFSWAAERQIRGGRLGLGGPHSPDVVEDQLLGGRLNTCGPMDVPVVHRVVEQRFKCSSELQMLHFIGLLEGSA
jgi:hypothetical protein